MQEATWLNVGQQMTKRYAAIFPRVISCCPKSSGQNRDRGQSYYGDSNCRELDVSIDNGWQGSKVYSPRSLSIEYPNKARTEDPPARLPPGNPFQALTASEFTLQDQQLRHEPTAGTWMDVSVNGFAATPVCLSKAKGRVVGGGCRCWIYVCLRHWFIAESSVSVQRGKRVSHDDQTRPVNELEILEGETWTMRWLGILGWGR